jgi:penicillin amidase
MKLPMSSYRADRISALLQEKEALTVEDMKQIHYDCYALQAEVFMAIIRPLLPETENGEILRQWDLCYTAESLGATLFERVYRELILLVFGDCGVGREVMTCLMDESLLFNMLHGHFDRILLRASSVWFEGQSREGLYKTAIERGLKGKAVARGEECKVYVEHLLFRGKMPRFLGFDYPLTLTGSRSTVPQVGASRASGLFAATLRMICDFDTDGLHANVAGGASDRRFSKYYTSGLREWENGDYEVFEP